MADEQDSDEFSKAIALLGSDSWVVVKDAIDTIADYLRNNSAAPEVVTQLNNHCERLAKHSKWEVRKSLAHACLYYRGPYFNHVMAILEQDDNAYVQRAASRTLSRRAEISKTDVLKDEHSERVHKWLNKLEATHGVAARNAAQKVAEKIHYQFVRELNHEIRKVVSTLDGTLVTLKFALSQKRLNRKELNRHLERSQQRLSYVYSILDSLQSLTQDVPVEFELQRVALIIDEVINLVKDRKEENKRMHAEIDIPKELTIMANWHWLVQALTNIVQNAIEAYPADEKQTVVKIQANAINDYFVCIHISDYGCGMSEKGKKYALQLFSTTKIGGTGFGLSIAKKIIESDHGGSININSIEGKGTTVTITLPTREKNEL